MLIDFEHFPGPDGVLGTGDDVPTPTCGLPTCSLFPVASITSEYAPVGVSFTNALLYHDTVTWHGHFLSASHPDITFSAQVREASITSKSFWNATLTAYDASNNVVDTSVFIHPAPGSTEVLATLTVTSSIPIARLTILPDNLSQVLNLDDLVFGPNNLDFFTVEPCRVTDTRTPADGPALAAGTERDFVVAGACGIPATARAVALNIAATDATTVGHLRLFTPGMPVPPTSAINYGPNQDRSHGAIVDLPPAGSVRVRCNQPSGTVHFIIDVTGYFE